MSAAVQAKELMKIWGGFRASRVLITANNLEIFEHLKNRSSATALAKKIKTEKRATEILLDALTGLGLLVKAEDRYINSDVANNLLVKSSPYYQGDIIRHADSMWKNWSALDEVLKSGKPAGKAHNHEAFILGMHNVSMFRVESVLNAVGTRSVETALDLGGGPGSYSSAMAEAGVIVTLFDYPETVAIAKRLALKKKVKNLNFIEGDFLSDDIGKGYDLVFVSQILHAYSEKDSLSLLKKCKKALNAGGRVVIQETYINDQRTLPVPSSLFSVNMLVATVGGRCYTPSELKTWLFKAGFSNISETLLADSVLVQGNKP